MEKLTTLIPDPQDARDYIYEWEPTDKIPVSVDLRQYTGFVENQYSVGSCTANAMVGAAEMFLIANGAFKDTEATDKQDLSRLFNYFTSRSYFPQKFQDNDLGSIARYALRAAKNYGICSEQTHPYIVSNWNTKPSEAAYQEAKLNTVGAYYRIPLIGPSLSTHPVIEAIKHALAKGYPVMVGMQVGEQIRNLTPSEDYRFVSAKGNPSIGGHEMLIVGYNDDEEQEGTFIVRNSWGKDWCDGGYFYCRQRIIAVDAWDLWVVKGFGGYETIGKDSTIPATKPQPEPAPEPAEPSKPEPVIEPPTPQEKDSNLPVIIGVVVVVALILLSHFQII